MALASVLSKRTGAQFQPDGAVNIVASTLTGAQSMGFWADREVPQRRNSFVGVSGNTRATAVDISPLLPFFYNSKSSGQFSQTGVSVANLRVGWRVEALDTHINLPTTGNIQILLQVEGIIQGQPFTGTQVQECFDVATQLNPYTTGSLENNQSINGAFVIQGIPPETTKISVFGQWAGCPVDTDCYLIFDNAFAIPLAPVFTNEPVILPPVIPKPPNIVLYPNP